MLANMVSPIVLVGAVCATFLRIPIFAESKDRLNILQSQSESEWKFQSKVERVVKIEESTTNSPGSYPNCSGYDIIPCCWSSVDLPCSEFNKDPYNVETCGEQCGIPCVDDINEDPDIGVVIEADDITNTTKCYDHKPEACCQFLARYSLCSETFFKGCRKSCSQC